MIALNSTTLSAALNATEKRLTLAALTNVALGHVLVVDGEAMLAQAIDTPSLTVEVFRGYRGYAVPHVSGALVWTNVPQAYYSYDPVGAGNPLNEEYLPHVNLQTFNTHTLINGRWVLIAQAGAAVALPAGAVTPYTAAGAITLVPGVHQINGAAAIAMTLAAPGPQTPEGTILVIEAGTAAAHTVTYAAGFAATGAASDVATFGGAIGDSMVIQNIGGAWRILSLSNVVVA